MSHLDSTRDRVKHTCLHCRSLQSTEHLMMTFWLKSVYRSCRQNQAGSATNRSNEIMAKMIGAQQTGKCLSYACHSTADNTVDTPLIIFHIRGGFA